MVQGDLIPIALKRNSGLQEYTFIIVHFKGGNPDTGRKSFQPELKEIAEHLASKITAYIINFRDLFKPDTGATKNLDPENNLYKLIKSLVKYRDTNPIAYPSISKNFTYLSKPQEEQDVIAVFNQLIGIGIIKGIFIYSNSYNLMYDSIIELNYDESCIYNDANELGVRSDIQLGEPYHPMVLEYKFDFDALLREFDNGTKYASHIQLVVCWKVSGAYKEDYTLKSLLIEREGNTRVFFGATHKAFLPGKLNGATIELIILEDLINFLLHPDSEIANQKAKYGNT